MKCQLCPRKCNVDRIDNSNVGVCGVTNTIRIARADLHYFEEPCISGEKGSGTIFFSGCPLKCIFCQNKEISLGLKGNDISVEKLKTIIKDLINKGAHNINFVTPTHYTHEISKVLDEKISVPVVYNCAGYEEQDTLKMLKGKIDVYLPDLKYSDDNLALKYSKVPNYFKTAQKAILEMYNQVGDYILDEDGIMQKGVIIRHLMLPENLENTYGVIEWVADNFKNKKVKFSLMSQYTPLEEYPYSELNRRVSREEYQKAVDYMYLCGITDGYTQEPTSADEIYIPDFNQKI